MHSRAGERAHRQVSPQRPRKARAAAHPVRARPRGRGAGYGRVVQEHVACAVQTQARERRAGIGRGRDAGAVVARPGGVAGFGVAGVGSGDWGGDAGGEAVHHEAERLRRHLLRCRHQPRPRAIGPEPAQDLPPALWRARHAARAADAQQLDVRRSVARRGTGRKQDLHDGDERGESPVGLEERLRYQGGERAVRGAAGQDDAVRADSQESIDEPGGHRVIWSVNDA